MSNQAGAKFEVVENAQEVTEDFGLPTQQPKSLGSEQNAGVDIFLQNMTPSGIASHPLEDILQNAKLEQQRILHRVPNASPKRNTTSGAIPKNHEASGLMKSDPNPAIKNPSGDLAFWEDTGAIPKYLTQEYTSKASKYLPPFKKPQSQRPKPKMQPPSVVPPKQPPVEELQQQELNAELQRVEVRQELVEELRQNPRRSDEIAAELLQECQRPDIQQGLSPELEQKPQLEVRQETRRERLSSRSEQAQFVRQHCLDFQDYKRTVNNRQKSLEQSLNLILPKMNTAMVDAQNLASKIEKVRSQDCETEEALKIQNDKMKYLVGRTVGTISKIDGLFDRFRTDILDYTTLTTEGNAGIDRRLSKLLMILCGMDDKDPEKEENKVIRDSFEQDDGLV